MSIITPGRSSKASRFRPCSASARELSLSGQSDLLLSIRQSTQDSVNQAGQQITQKNLNIQPTIKVRPGWPLRVIVHKDLVLRPYRG